MVLGAEPPGQPAHPLEREETRRFGAWTHPWSPEVISECAARLLLRSSHDTLVGGSQALFVLLSFLTLHRKLGELGQVPGVDVVRVATLSLSGDLASWADAQGSGAEQAWRRFEVRALLREALAQLQPFADPGPSEGWLSALCRCMQASGLRGAPEELRRLHAERCVEDLLPALLGPPPARAAVAAPAVRYVALSVEAHHAALEAALREAAAAMAVSEDPFPAPPFARPLQLHITTLFLGEAVPSEAQRRLLYYYYYYYYY